jgi:hypothetical protein
MSPKKSKTRKKSFADCRKDSFIKRASMHEQSSYALNSLKDKLEHFYYAYNKSLVFEDGMNFSEDEIDEEETDTPSAGDKSKGKQSKWTLLQSMLLYHNDSNFGLEFICQNNDTRFSDNIEEISRGELLNVFLNARL